MTHKPKTGNFQNALIEWAFCFVFFRIFRIEFDHRHLDYFTEIDGVEVEGIKFQCDDLNSTLFPIIHHRNQQLDKGPIQRKLERVQFRPLYHNNHQDVLKDFLVRDLENFIAEINNGYGIDVPDDSESSQLTLKNLPVRSEEFLPK